MKRKLRALFILCAAAAVLSVGIVLLQESPRPEAAVEEEEVSSCTVTDFPVSTVTALAVTNAENSIGFLLQGENIELILADSNGQLSSSEMDYSLSELRSTVYTLCHMQGTKELPMPEDRDTCGYSAPVANLTFIFSDGTQREYLLGSKLSGDKGYYFFDLAGEKLFVIDGSTAEPLLRTERDFISHSLFPTVDTADYTSVTRIDFERNGESFTVENTDGDFYLVSPLYQRLRAYNVYSTIVAPLGGIYAEKCIATGAELEKNGFAEPDLKVSMSVSGKTYTAWFKSDGEELLMADPGKGNIFTLDSDLLLLLPENCMSLLDGKACYYSLGDCRELRAVSGNSDVTFSFSGSGKELQAQCGGRTLDEEETTALSQSLNGLEIAGRFSGEAAGDPALTLYFTFNNGRTETVRLIPEGNAYICAVNETANFTVSSLSVSNLISALGAYTSDV